MNANSLEVVEGVEYFMNVDLAKNKDVKSALLKNNRDDSIIQIKGLGRVKITENFLLHNL